MALTSTFIQNYKKLLDTCCMLMARAYQRLTASRLKRVARGVALALVGSLCLAQPTSQAQTMQTELTPFRYASFLTSQVEASCLFKIALKESNVRYDAINRSSGASGAWQFMNVKVRELSPLEQVEWAIRYANSRYGSPCQAWDKWQERAKSGVGWW